MSVIHKSPPMRQQPPAPPPDQPSQPSALLPRRHHRGRFVLALIIAVALAVGFGVSRITRITPPTTSSAGTTGTTLSLAALESKVDPALVDVVSTLGYQNGEAAGTGIVVSSTGEVLTNNHVIDGATSITVTDIGNGRTYTATVVGYDKSADIAVLQLEGASGLQTVTLGDSTKVGIGESVVALGNAEGRGGTPSASTGTVTGLNQSITATDESGGTSEQLSGLLQTNATLQPGDSGGPLVDMEGQVVGIDSAASSGFQFQSGSSQSYAIPITQAITLADQIEAHHSSATIHIGRTAFLGVEVTNNTYGSTGAAVTGVGAGSPAANAGITAGDLITSISGKTVDSTGSLTTVMKQYHPGDQVTVTWSDESGQTHSAAIVLTTGPAG
jgi:S1-C subfamily serine protease